MVKDILARLGITAAASAIDARMKKENTWFWNNHFNHFIISNKEMNVIMEIVQALEDSDILRKRVTKNIKM